MKDQHNLDRLKQAYAYWDDNKEQAFENWMGLLADDVTFRSLADGAPGMEFTRTCHCKDDVLRYFEELSGQWEMVYYRMDEYVAEGDRIVAIGNCCWRYRANGKLVETPKVDIVTFRDSKVIEFFELYNTAKALAATQS